MIKYYKILSKSGVILYVKTDTKKMETIEICCIGNNPYKMNINKNQYYSYDNRKLTLEAESFTYDKDFVSFKKITEEKFNEFLSLIKNNEFLSLIKIEL